MTSKQYLTHTHTSKKGWRWGKGEKKIRSEVWKKRKEGRRYGRKEERKVEEERKKGEKRREGG